MIYPPDNDRPGIKEMIKGSLAERIQQLAPLPQTKCQPPISGMKADYVILDDLVADYAIPKEIWYSKPQKQQGNNPMYNKTATSSIDLTVQTSGPTKSDAMIQREYLLQQLAEMTRNSWDSDGWYSVTLSKLRKQFNIGASTVPSTSQEIIDAFKNGKIVINQKKVDAQTAFFAASEAEQDDLWVSGIRDKYYGITFTDIPVENRKGYDAAVEQLNKLIESTKRKIMILDPLAGLDALTTLEAWTPTTAAS